MWRQVYAQLVRASRDGEEPNERDIAKGRFPPGSASRRVGPRSRTARVKLSGATRSIGASITPFGIRQNAADQRKVFLAKGIRLHLPLDMRLHIRQFGE